MKNKDGLKSSALIADAKKLPFYHIVIVVLLAVGLSSLPLEKLFIKFFSDDGNAYLCAGAVVRFLLCAAAVELSLKYGFYKPYVSSAKITTYLLLVPALLVTVNNFPLVRIFGGECEITEDGERLALYILYCFSVAAFEETVFRGIIFPLSYIALEGKKRRLFWSAALSSGIFAAAHIFNLFAGAGIGATLLQIGYSFLIGGLCAVSLITVKNIYLPVVFHFIYDLGGFFCEGNIGIASCARWDTLTVAITAVLGVFTAVYMVILAIKKDKTADINLFSEEQKGAAEEENKEDGESGAV